MLEAQVCCVDLQEAEREVPREEPTVPGEPPGVYGCDYQTLVHIAVLHAEARMALLSRDPQVRPFISQCSLSCHWPLYPIPCVHVLKTAGKKGMVLV